LELDVGPGVFIPTAQEELFQDAILIDPETDEPVSTVDAAGAARAG